MIQHPNLINRELDRRMFRRLADTAMVDKILRWLNKAWVR